VHVVADLPADPQTAEVVQEREGTLDDPSLSAQAGAVFGVAACDQWPDAEFAYRSPVLVVVVSAVREDHVGASAGRPHLPPHRRHGFQQRDELGDVVAVTAGEREREREKSSGSAACSFAGRTSCSRCRRPASCHSARRRQHVISEPKPSSWGSCSQEIPVCSTSRMPCRTSRSSRRLRPG
jgi:hypothetical protein